ncbi:hypothetical protein [Burkholderia cepacia]|uniref:hypothetical protein n=1 Tax=Burkholderia cepacia TaxID=292 RepID=UPI002AB641AB|nr:hypothetical protein [Burkholderia cepacia]
MGAPDSQCSRPVGEWGEILVVPGAIVGRTANGDRKNSGKRTTRICAKGDLRSEASVPLKEQRVSACNMACEALPVFHGTIEGVLLRSEGSMASVIREPVDGCLIRMNDEVGKRALPGCVFLFCRMSMDGTHPVVEMRQPGWSAGTRYFVPFKDEAAVREFLLRLGFTEMPRVTPGDGTPEWELERDE